MIVAWNVLVISGLARAATVFERGDYLQLAVQAAGFILEHQWVNGRCHRLNYAGTPAVFAQAEDYALFIKALLDIQQASLVIPLSDIAVDWLAQAEAVQAEFDRWLWSDATKGYYNTASDASDSLLVKERSYQDSATPAANGVAISNLMRLSLLAKDLAYFDRAEEALKAFSVVMDQATRGCPTLFQALDWYRHQTLVRTTTAHIATLSREYAPTTIFVVDAQLPENVVGLVCQGLTCKEPATSYAQMKQQLAASQQRVG